MIIKPSISRTIVALAAMIWVPIAGFAQSILLSAGDFTLLGGTAITSTGTVGTMIYNGNVGLSPGATSGITGFPPAVIVNGAIVATGPVTAQARLDLIRASVGLAGMPSNANMSTVDLGGKTLAPGVYTFNDAASLSGALVLDAQGQNSVAWVFQIGTAFTSSINSTVTIINLGSNGGSDLGIFWNAGSAVNIGANNQLAGNYLAGTSIVMGGLSAGGGRALALAGISLDTNTINARGGLAGGDYSGGLKYAPDGSVVLSGGSGGTTVIAPGVVDGGIGSFGGSVANSGTLSPGLTGGAPGVLVVGGNFTQSSTGTLVIELASPTSFDRLVVTGTAALAGTVQIDSVSGYNPVGQSFTFLTAPGGVSGTFGTLSGSATTNRAAVAANLVYTPNSVTVSFAQLPFSGFATTSNQAMIGDAAQASPELTAVLNNLALASQFPAALNALSPQGYQIWSDIAFAHKTALANRLSRADYAVVGHDEYYFDGSQRRGRAKGDSDVRQSTFTSTAGLVGGNHALDDNRSVGGFFENAKTVSDLGSAGSRSTAKSNTFGLRAENTQGAWFTHAVLGYGFDNYKSTRPVVFTGTSAVASAETKGRQWFAGISAGQHLTSGPLTLSPYAGLLASGWRAKGFTETGAGAFNATVGRQSARSLRSRLGAEARFDWKVGSLALSPHARAAWLHEFSNDSRVINAAFGPANYGVSTRRPERDSAQLSAGVDLLLGPGALVYADFSTESGGITKILSEWRVGLVLKF